jgi:hypothetical protein
MKIKVFKIGLDDRHLEKDQKTLEAFLESHDNIKVETAFVQDEKYWSVVLYFEELKIVQQNVVKILKRQNTPQKMKP